MSATIMLITALFTFVVGKERLSPFETCNRTSALAKKGKEKCRVCDTRSSLFIKIGLATIRAAAALSGQIRHRLGFFGAPKPQ